MVWLFVVLLLLVLTNLGNNSNNYTTQAQTYVGDFFLSFEKSNNASDYRWRCGIYADGNLITHVVANNLESVVLRTYSEIGLAQRTPNALRGRLPSMANQMIEQLGGIVADDSVNDALVNGSVFLFFCLYIGVLGLGIYTLITTAS